MISQAIIALTGLLSIYLVQNPSGRYYKWGCVFGVIGQPFWVVESLKDNQAGVLLLSVVYTFVWGKSFYKLWIKEKLDD